MATSYAPRQAAGNEKPTHARYWVIIFAISLAMLANIDRVCISVVTPIMSKDLGLTKSQMGLILSAFGLGYALFEIPGGYMGDIWGPRRVLMRIVLWWSAFTAITGAMWNLSSMIVTRFLFGAGEAGCFPNLTKAFSVWLPQAEKTRAQGIMWTFARWGGAFTPKIVLFVLGYFTWRQSFFVFGVFGVVWAAVFYWWFRDDPKQHRGVNAGELALLPSGPATTHQKAPWGALLQSRSIWLLWLQYFLLSYPWYFYISWLTTYLRDQRQLDQQAASTYAVLPLFFGGIGCLVSGFMLPRLSRAMGSVARARRWLASGGFAGAATLLFMCTQTADVTTAILFMALASFCNDLVMPGAWASCMDIGGEYAGTVAGSMNMMGNIAGFTAPAIGGYLTDYSGGNWNPFLYTMVAAYVLGTFCWPFIDPVTPLRVRESK